MNKTLGGIFLALVLFLIGLASFFYNTRINSVSNSPTPTLTPTKVQTTNVYCTPGALQSNIDLSPGAGNVYGNLTLKNISNKPCTIIGSNFITAKYDPVVINISIEHVGKIEANTFLLSPNQTIYSQIHYPNGPQCSDRTIATPLTFEYRFAPNNTIVFAQKDQETQTINTCISVKEITTIQTWNMSQKPITP